jgi:flavin reductase (DIM6/NTAB) family NADH-FMN oxidoreductase RutF
MHFDPDQSSLSEVYSLMIRAITPRPIAWVSTISANGIPNLAPFSYFAGVGSNPASLVFSCVNRPDGSPKDTLRNLQSIPQFVVHVVPHELAEAMVKTSAELAFEESEFEFAGLESQPSQRVKPPGVAQAPIRMECEVMQIIPVGEGAGGSNMVLGKILLIDIDKKVLDANGKIDPDKLDSIGRMGGRMYCRTRDRFEMK